jgi:hypothetical protein
MAYNGTVLITDACISLRPNSGVSLSGTNVSDVVWDPDTIDSADGVPTNSEIVAEQSRLQAIEDAQSYARLRKAKYDLLNQDEMRFDDQANSTTTWVDAINAIKAAHPKP